jgi:hypothetical protein
LIYAETVYVGVGWRSVVQTALLFFTDRISKFGETPDEGATTDLVETRFTASPRVLIASFRANWQRPDKPEIDSPGPFSHHWLVPVLKLARQPQSHASRRRDEADQS